MNKIVMFYGSNRDFDEYVAEHEEVYDITPFMSIVKDYNAKLRPNTAQNDEERDIKKPVAVVVVKADEYGSVVEHVISNFHMVITLNHEISRLYLQNPPKRIDASLRAQYTDIIEEEFTEYEPMTRDVLRTIYSKVNTEIIGQAIAKKRVFTTMYKACGIGYSKPIVIMLLGPSGVGKTETAKSISRSLGGELLRIQFSMMQSQEAYNYVFGAEHSKSSLARDLFGRETNIILIDEFDKVNTIFYNAFYQIFDEGVYVDTTYTVDVRNSVIFCTSNYDSAEEAKAHLGAPIFSRFDAMVKYEYLSQSDKETILGNIYRDSMDFLHPDEKLVLEDKHIHELFAKNLHLYDNVRLLRSSVEEAIFSELFNVFVEYGDSDSDVSDEETCATRPVVAP